jgi:hypothetical protein
MASLCITASPGWGRQLPFILPGVLGPSPSPRGGLAGHVVCFLLHRARPGSWSWPPWVSPEAPTPDAPRSPLCLLCHPLLALRVQSWRPSWLDAGRARAPWSVTDAQETGRGRAGRLIALVPGRKGRLSSQRPRGWAPFPSGGGGPRVCDCR